MNYFGAEVDWTDWALPVRLGYNLYIKEVTLQIGPFIFSVFLDG